MVPSVEKDCKYFIGYKSDDDYKIQPLGIMLPKGGAYVSYDGETK